MCENSKKTGQPTKDILKSGMGLAGFELVKLNPYYNLLNTNFLFPSACPILK